MRKRDLVWRPEQGPRHTNKPVSGLSSGAQGDPAADSWRRFVLDQVGYDEAARERAGRRAARSLAIRGFVRGLAGGLLLAAAVLAILLVALSWREEMLARDEPRSDGPIAATIIHGSRNTRTTARPDTHEELANPLAFSARPAQADDDDTALPDDAADRD